ncbi:hypothetical protein GQX73_g10610 [Xylaria multiplex]|uniref:F-box domain-containing protein n=1 Tax=Xylaria multiplex TaxID=323545 RepID=A0A7C8MZP8_9PEZI|nr:hypothetical protein GQX73_g10610 [Xylaria multiplex]
MPLLDLPSELLDQVVWESIPEDFENLILSCRTLHEYGKPYIDQHTARKRQFHTMRIDACSDMSWLANFAIEPRIPFYANIVNLRGHVEIESEDDSEDDSTEGEYERVKQLVKALIKQSPYLAIKGIDTDFWVDMILSELGDGDGYACRSLFLGIFYLTLFPNVTNLTLPWHAPGRVFHHDHERATNQYELVLNAIAQKSRSKHNRRALGKLKCLTYTLLTNYKIYQPLQFLLPFLILPELEELRATSLTAIKFHQEFKWTYPDIHSNLRTIELKSCCMDAVGISELLAHTPKLTTLKYQHASKHHGMEAYWDSGEFVTAIEKKVGGQLKHLAITVAIDAINGIKAGVTSMHRFTQLETLELDLPVFYGPSIESGEKAGIVDTPPIPGYAKWTVNATPPLCRILPASIREFTLFAHFLRNAAIDSKAMLLLYNGFRTARPLCLPNLRQNSVGFLVRSRGQYIPRYEEICDRLEAEGVEHRVFMTNFWR